jgi:hypothetical protein
MAIGQAISGAHCETEKGIMKTTIGLILATSILSTGCASLLPNSIGPEFAHSSHISQHQPFTSHPTNIAYETVGVTARWHTSSGFYLDVSEAYNMAPKDGQVCAGMCGPREIFTARAGYAFQVRP